MSHKMKRSHYADMFGPTTGDKVRLGDTSLIAEIAAPVQSADNATAGVQSLDIPLGFPIPSGTHLLWTMHHVAAANTSWQAVVIGGNY